MSWVRKPVGAASESVFARTERSSEAEAVSEGTEETVGLNLTGGVPRRTAALLGVWNGREGLLQRPGAVR